MTTIREFLDRHADDLVALRHELHQIPEVGLDLPQTQSRVLRELDGLPLEVRLGEGLSSVTAVLRGGRRGDDSPVVLLRGDMDALPVAEQTGQPFASTNGRMHACGHDLHTAMLTFAAKALCEVRDELAGDVVFMFQPGEESCGGARLMLDEGVLDAAGRRADHAYGIHVFSALAPGLTFCTKPGPMLSNSDSATITIHGRGGHGSTPHLAADPVVVMGEVISQLQVMVTREFDMFDPVVVTVGSAHAGEAYNVIPAEATLGVTLRSYSRAAQDRLHTAIPRLVHGIAAAHGCTADVEMVKLYPVTINDDDETGFATDTIVELFGAERHTRWDRPLGGSEDFSFVLAEVPGTFIGLSAVPLGADPSAQAFNHSPFATFADDCLVDGAQLLAELARRRLA